MSSDTESEIPTSENRDTTVMENLRERNEWLEDRLAEYRSALFEMADTAASWEGPKMDPENVWAFSGLLRQAVDEIEDAYFETVVETVIAERRDDAGMED